MATRKMTEAKDDRLDKRAGIKEGSARDKALDKKRGVPEMPAAPKRKAAPSRGYSTSKD